MHFTPLTSLALSSVSAQFATVDDFVRLGVMAGPCPGVDLDHVYALCAAIVEARAEQGLPTDPTASDTEPRVHIEFDKSLSKHHPLVAPLLSTHFGVDDLLKLPFVTFYYTGDIYDPSLPAVAPSYPRLGDVADLSAYTLVNLPKDLPRYTYESMLARADLAPFDFDYRGTSADGATYVHETPLDKLRLRGRTTTLQHFYTTCSLFLSARSVVEHHRLCARSTPYGRWRRNVGATSYYVHQKTTDRLASELRPLKFPLYFSRDAAERAHLESAAVKYPAFINSPVSGAQPDVSRIHRFNSHLTQLILLVTQPSWLTPALAAKYAVRSIPGFHDAASDVRANSIFSFVQGAGGFSMRRPDGIELTQFDNARSALLQRRKDDPRSSSLSRRYADGKTVPLEELTARVARRNAYGGEGIDLSSLLSVGKIPELPPGMHPTMRTVHNFARAHLYALRAPIEWGRGAFTFETFFPEANHTGATFRVFPQAALAYDRHQDVGPAHSGGVIDVQTLLGNTVSDDAFDPSVASFFRLCGEELLATLETEHVFNEYYQWVKRDYGWVWEPKNFLDPARNSQLYGLFPYAGYPRVKMAEDRPELRVDAAATVARDYAGDRRFEVHEEGNTGENLGVFGLRTQKWSAKWSSPFAALTDEQLENSFKLLRGDFIKRLTCTPRWADVMLEFNDKKHLPTRPMCTDVSLPNPSSSHSLAFVDNLCDPLAHDHPWRVYISVLAQLPPDQREALARYLLPLNFANFVRYKRRCQLDPSDQNEKLVSGWCARACNAGVPSTVVQSISEQLDGTDLSKAPRQTSLVPRFRELIGLFNTDFDAFAGDDPDHKIENYYRVLAATCEREHASAYIELARGCIAAAFHLIAMEPTLKARLGASLNFVRNGNPTEQVNALASLLDVDLPVDPSDVNIADLLTVRAIFNSAARDSVTLKNNIAQLYQIAHRALALVPSDQLIQSVRTREALPPELREAFQRARTASLIYRAKQRNSQTSLGSYLTRHASDDEIRDVAYTVNHLRAEFAVHWETRDDLWDEAVVASNNNSIERQVAASTGVEGPMSEDFATILARVAYQSDNNVALKDVCYLTASDLEEKYPDFADEYGYVDWRKIVANQYSLQQIERIETRDKGRMDVLEAYYQRERAAHVAQADETREGASVGLSVYESLTIEKCLQAFDCSLLRDIEALRPKFAAAQALMIAARRKGIVLDTDFSNNPDDIMKGDLADIDATLSALQTKVETTDNRQYTPAYTWLCDYFGGEPEQIVALPRYAKVLTALYRDLDSLKANMMAVAPKALAAGNWEHMAVEAACVSAALSSISDRDGRRWINQIDLRHGSGGQMSNPCVVFFVAVGNLMRAKRGLPVFTSPRFVTNWQSSLAVHKAYVAQCASLSHVEKPKKEEGLTDAASSSQSAPSSTATGAQP